MMMVLEYYKIIEKANWYEEKRLYRIYHSKYIEGTPFSALAYHLSKKGLNAYIYHSEQNFFSNNNKIFSKECFELAMNEYQEFLNYAVNNGTKVYRGIELNSMFIKDKLNEDNIIILAGELTNEYHAILICGYENDSFVVCDPLYKEKQIKTIDEIEKFMDTNIGKWLITVKQN